MSETDHGCWYEPEAESALPEPSVLPKLEGRSAAQEPAGLSEVLVDPNAGPPAFLWHKLEDQLRADGLIRP